MASSAPATPIAPTGLHAGTSLVPLGHAAVEAGVAPSTLYHRGLAGDFKLVRHVGRWCVARWELDAWLAKRAEVAHG